MKKNDIIEYAKELNNSNLDLIIQEKEQNLLKRTQEEIIFSLDSFMSELNTFLENDNSQINTQVDTLSCQGFENIDNLSDIESSDKKREEFQIRLNTWLGNLALSILGANNSE